MKSIDIWINSWYKFVLNFPNCSPFPLYRFHSIFDLCAHNIIMTLILIDSVKNFIIKFNKIHFQKLMTELWYFWKVRLISEQKETSADLIVFEWVSEWNWMNEWVDTWCDYKPRRIIVISSRFTRCGVNFVRNNFNRKLDTFNRFGFRILSHHSSSDFPHL